MLYNLDFVQNDPVDVISDADERTSESPSSPLSPIEEDDCPMEEDDYPMEEDDGTFWLIGGLLMLILVLTMLIHFVV